jgi:hypothetical protein
MVMTVRLHGPKAAGRVALVDDGDYELVSNYRWYVKETEPRPGNRGIGPYALTIFKNDPLGRIAPDGRSHSLLMHKLITGWPKTDHHDHDGLNNQRYNLRPVTDQQNHFNRRGDIDTSSRYKGVNWFKRKRKWRASIKVDGIAYRLGSFLSETEAATAYDAAAARKHGVYACLNFPEGITPAVLEQIRAEREDAEAARTTRICTVCGSEYRSARQSSRYCSGKCSDRAGCQRKKQRREAERERDHEGRLF